MDKKLGARGARFDDIAMRMRKLPAALESDIPTMTGNAKNSALNETGTSAGELDAR